MFLKGLVSDKIGLLKRIFGVHICIQLGPEYPVHAAMSAELLTEGPAQALA
jgi:hypothetical protein